MSEEDWGKEAPVTIKAERKEKYFQIKFIYLSAYKNIGQTLDQRSNYFRLSRSPWCN